MEDELLKCPKCGSFEVTAAHEQMFMVNTGKHYCHRIKTHDSNARATCIDCDWVGVRDDLVVHNAAMCGGRNEPKTSDGA